MSRLEAALWAKLKSEIKKHGGIYYARLETEGAGVPDVVLKKGKKGPVVFVELKIAHMGKNNVLRLPAHFTEEQRNFLSKFDGGLLAQFKRKNKNVYTFIFGEYLNKTEIHLEHLKIFIDKEWRQLLNWIIEIKR